MKTTELKTLYFDVMLDGMFQRTLQYKYYKNIPIEERKLKEYVEKKMPTLKGKNFTIEF